MYKMEIRFNVEAIITKINKLNFLLLLLLGAISNIESYSTQCVSGLQFMLAV